jgi:peptide/nickel transport system substrate-binding protein
MYHSRNLSTGTGSSPHRWLAYDPARSQSLLEEAGWRIGDRGGVRERDGVEFAFNMIVENRYQAAAVYVQDKLAEVGIRAEITSLEWGVLWDRVEARDFDVAVNYIWVSPDDPDAGLEIMFGEESLIGYHNPHVIALVNEALEATTPRRLDTIYQQLAPIMQEEQPVTFLTFGTEMYVAHDRIKGLSSPFRANPLWHAGRLWIEGDEP